MKKKLTKVAMTAVLASVTLLSTNMVAFAGQNCPYCDTECVIKFNHPEICGNVTAWTAGDTTGASEYTMSHAELVYKGQDLVSKDGMNVIDQAKFFDGSNPYTLYNVRWNANFSPIGFTINDPGYEGIETYIDPVNGIYKRFDGQTYNFDPLLYDYVSKLGINTDLRYWDWVATNNSKLPKVVEDRLIENNNIRAEYPSKYDGTAKCREEFYGSIYENLEVGLEILYGMIPMDEQ